MYALTTYNDLQHNYYKINLTKNYWFNLLHYIELTTIKFTIKCIMTYDYCSLFALHIANIKYHYIFAFTNFSYFIFITSNINICITVNYAISICYLFNPRNKYKCKFELDSEEFWSYEAISSFEPHRHFFLIIMSGDNT